MTTPTNPAATPVQSPAEGDDERVGAMTYQGNTVSYIAQRAKVYGEEIMRCWHVLKDAGAHPGRTDGKLHEVIRAALSNVQPKGTPADALGYATRLAESIFNKHYASDSHYASGEVVWSACDDLLGVLTQIDNMTVGLARSVQSPAPAPVTTGLRKAAQDILDRWNSPKWEWAKQGPTADLMKMLRDELDADQSPAVAHEPACWVDGGDLEQLKKLGMGGVLGWPDHGNDPRRVPLFKGTAAVPHGKEQP